MLTARVFRLFVSSTFSDFIAEREALRTLVFPKLERLCAARGARFEAIDLRWGITEEAQRDHDTMRICLEEVRRCQQLSPRPNFAVLLGNRYGWEPVPARIPCDHWRRLRSAASTADWVVIERSYRLDLNAVPPVYCLKSRKTSSVVARHEARLLAALRRAARRFRGAGRLPYFASATHQEIALGALSRRDEAGRALHPEQHVHVYMRHLEGLPQHASARGFIDWDETQGAVAVGARDKLHGLGDELRRRLGSHVHHFSTSWRRHGRNGAVDREYLDRFCETFFEHQQTLIEAELAGLEDTDEGRERDLAHRRFGAERSRVFAGRTALLTRIDRYVCGSIRGSTSKSVAPLVLVGGGGNGKSALLARAAQRSERKRSLSHARVLQRYIGGVPGSEALIPMVAGLIADIASAYDRPAPPAPAGAKALAEAFMTSLSLASARRPLVLYLDALDQFDAADSAWMLEWLPRTLPPYVRIVASLRAGLVVEQAARRRFTQGIVEVPSMTPSEGRAMLDAWLADRRASWFNAGVAPGRGRRLTAIQRRTVLRGFTGNGSPLWLKLAYEEAAGWTSWQKPRRPPDTVHGIITAFVERKLLDGENHPRRFTEQALAYLTAGRFGLSESELGRALATDVEVRAEFEANERTQRKWEDLKALPPILWSRLFFDLEPYLGMSVTAGASLMRWFHREFAEVMRQRYLCTDEDRETIHGALAGVFHDLERELRPEEVDDDALFRATDAGGRQVSAALRRVMEQPWQLVHAGRAHALVELLTDFGFCMGKCAANQGADLVADFRAGTRLSGDALKASSWMSLISEKGHMLRRGEERWPAHKIFLQLAIEHADDSPVTQRAEAWSKRGFCDWPWIVRSARPAVYQPTPLVAVLEGHDARVNGMTTIASDRLLSWSEDGTLRVWDIEEGVETAVLSGHSKGVEGAFTVGTNTLLSWSEDGSIRCWDPSVGSCQRICVAHESGVAGLLDIGQGLVASWGVSDNRVSVWRIADLSCRSNLMASSGLVQHVCLVAPGTLAVAYDDGAIRIWLLDDKKIINDLSGHIDTVWRVIPLGKNRLVSWSKDQCVRVWDWTIGLCLHAMELTGSSLHLDDVRIIDDDTLLILAQSYDDLHKDAELRIWSPRDGRPCKTLMAPGCMVEQLEIAPDRRIWCSTVGGPLRVWSPDGEDHVDVDWHKESVSGIHFIKGLGVLTVSLSGRMVVADIGDMEARLSFAIRGDSIEQLVELGVGQYATYGQEGAIRLLTIPKDRSSWRIDQGLSNNEHDAKCSMARLPDGRYLSWSYDRTVRLWNAVSGDCECVFRGHRQHVNGAVQLTSGRFMSWSDDSTIRVWDERGTAISLKHEGVNNVKEIAGQRLMSFADDGIARFWDAGSGECLGSLPAICSWLGNDKDGLLLVAGADGQIYAVDPIRFRIARKFIGHSETVKGVAPVESSRFLSWADGYSGDHTVRLWDIASGTSLAVFHGHSNSVMGSCVLPDERFLSWSSDSSLRVWSGRSSECLAVLDGHEGVVLGAKLLTPKLIASWARDNSVRIWASDSFECVGVVRHANHVKGVKQLESGLFLSWGAVDALVWDLRNKEDGLVIEAAQSLYRWGDGFVQSDVIARDMAIKLDGLDIDGTLVLSWLDGVCALSALGGSLVAKWTGESGEVMSSYGAHADGVGAVVACPGNEILVRGYRGLERFKRLNFPRSVNIPASISDDALYSSLMARAGSRKILTFAEVNDVLPADIPETNIEMLVERLIEAGVNLIDDTNGDVM
jgi:WD40 repeat protein